ncbi:hypothetical protein BD289DRAFT_444347 [Coniella lustricola]|uniref:Uncharacterized protein n=1 Tax=Coniella lustricola TaxID=2025994 RepID=A0A2T2ZW28_9PEZI|nr:hypothetical protein BD289DRAFT_444347 [Coniella lustricola]
MSAAKQSVRMQFLCEKRQLEFREDVPKSLVGPEAAMKPAMNRMFELTLGPIVMKHAADALDACEDKCSSKGCNRPATSIVATPMSYLHKLDDPFVIIMTVACCNSPQCDKILKQEARALMTQMSQERFQAIASFGVPPMSRGAKCYCGSGHKFKKCCGKDEADADAQAASSKDSAAGNGAPAAVAATPVAA